MQLKMHSRGEVLRMVVFASFSRERMMTLTCFFKRTLGDTLIVSIF